MESMREELIKTWEMVKPLSGLFKVVRVIKLGEDGGVLLNKPINSFEEFEEICLRYNGKANVYITINDHDGSVDSNGNALADKSHFKAIRGVVIDIDPKRPHNTASSDRELNLAEKIAREIFNDYSEYNPSLAMSGNGYHVWFPFLTPISSDIFPPGFNFTGLDEKTKLFNKILISKYSTDEVNIDNIGDLTRIIKIIGTTSVKGENTEERPWRGSKWIIFSKPDKRNDKLRDIILMLNPNKGKEHETKQIDNEPKYKIEEIERFRKINKKLDKLFKGEWKEYGSRSEAEMALVSLLVYYNFTREQIKKIMSSYNPIGKWNEKPESYHDLTINKAFMYVSSRYKGDDVSRSLKELVVEYLSSDRKNRLKQSLLKKISDLFLNEFFFITDKLDKLWVYEPEIGIYTPYGEELIQREVYNNIGAVLSKSDVAEIVAKVKARTRYIFKGEEDPFSPKGREHLIPMLNGVFNLETGELLKHSPEYRFIWRLPISYNPEAKSVKFLEFLKEVVEKPEEDIPVLQEFIGYTLYRKPLFHKALMLVGNGSNGKSTLISILKRFLSERNIVSIPLQQLEEDRFSIMQLYGKLANMFADLPSSALSNTGMFKTLTGGDYITGSIKHSNSTLSFVNTAKMIYSANEIPFTKDNSDAFFRRWIIIRFPYSFVDNVDAIKEEEKKEYTKKRNPKLVEEIINSAEEMSGIFNWAIEGLKRLLKKGDFSYSKDIKEIKEMYASWSNSVKVFIDEQCEITHDPDDYIQKDRLYQEFVKFVSDKGKTVLNKGEFTKKMFELNLGLRISKKTIAGERVNCWVGIKFKEEENPLHAEVMRGL